MIEIFFNLSLLSCFILITLKSTRLIFERSFYHQIVQKKIVYILKPTRNDPEFVRAFKLAADKFCVAGLDCEWSQNGKVSLLQVAFPDGSCFLIRLLGTTIHVFDDLLIWLKDRTKLKFGVGICEDSRRLSVDWNFTVAGCVDLRNLAVRVQHNGLDKMGLKNFAKRWLDVRYPFETDLVMLTNIQRSDWESDLTDEQIEYAALDGLVGALCPIEFLHLKLRIPLERAVEQLHLIKQYCQGCIDLRFKRIKKLGDQKMMNRKRLDYEKYFFRSSPIYDNSILLTPDGDMLSRLSRKKADWYIRKELGDKVCDDPFSVKLRFEPSGRATGRNDYYVQEKDNLCVVCGSKDSFVRKNIIPIEYRRHYPVSHKSHKSHDVLPLCLNCHRLSNIIDDEKKRALSILYDAPLGSQDSVLIKTDFNKSRVKNAAKALLYQKNIPDKRVKELETTICEFYHVGSVTEDLLKEATNLVVQNIGEQFVPHGLKVVATLDSPAKLVDFEIMWREHFVTKMQPQYLPIGWSIRHRVERYIETPME